MTRSPSPAFAWQEGYGAFTVGAPQCADVRQYIARQEEHHRLRAFQEEYVDFLQRGGVEYDERYLWCRPFRRPCRGSDLFVEFPVVALVPRFTTG